MEISFITDALLSAVLLVLLSGFLCAVFTEQSQYGVRVNVTDDIVERVVMIVSNAVTLSRVNVLHSCSRASLI